MTETECTDLDAITPKGRIKLERTSNDSCADTGEPMTWNEVAGKTTHAGPCAMARDHRHLELTIYPPVPPRPAPADLSYGYEEWHEDRAAERRAWMAKLLPEACLAAEYWRANHPHRQHKRPDPDKTWAEREWEHDILERFATLPHAASSDYQ